MAGASQGAREESATEDDLRAARGDDDVTIRVHIYTYPMHVSFIYRLSHIVTPVYMRDFYYSPPVWIHLYRSTFIFRTISGLANRIISAQESRNAAHQALHQAPARAGSILRQHPLLLLGQTQPRREEGLQAGRVVGVEEEGFTNGQVRIHPCLSEAQGVSG